MRAFFLSVIISVFYSSLCIAQSVPYSQDLRDQAFGGNAIAQNNLGLCYFFGNGIEQDYNSAVYWFREAAKQGQPDAQYDLGYCYYKGYGVNRSYEYAEYWYEKAALQGHAEAQDALADMYYYGKVKEDVNQAVYWYKKAAESGIPNSQSSLGSCYYEGIVVDVDVEQAVYWWTKAAQKNDFAGQFRLGGYYYSIKDYANAIKWFTLADSHVSCKYELGMSYYAEWSGQDYSKAYDYFKIAADENDPKAIAKIGDMFYFGHFVNQDFSKAFDQLLKASEHFIPSGDAMFRLSTCFRFGFGTTKDLDKAEYWLNKAQETGSDEAKMINEIMRR